MDVVLVGADAHPQRVVPDLANRDQMHVAAGGIDVPEGRIDPGLHAGEHLGGTEILTQRKAAGAAAARANHPVGADQRDRRRRAEIDLVIEFRQMLGVERSHDDTREGPVGVGEAPRELHRPFSADATDDGLAHEQLVGGAVDVDLEMLAIAQIGGRRGLRTHVRGAQDAVSIDDRHLDDDLAQHVGSADDGAQIGGILAGLDAAAQIQEGFVDLSDRAKHVLLEYHRKIVVRSLCFALVALNVLRVFDQDRDPNHRDDGHAEDGRASALS